MSKFGGVLLAGGAMLAAIAPAHAKHIDVPRYATGVFSGMDGPDLFSLGDYSCVTIQAGGGQDEIDVNAVNCRKERFYLGQDYSGGTDTVKFAGTVSPHVSFDVYGSGGGAKIYADSPGAIFGATDRIVATGVTFFLGAHEQDVVIGVPGAPFTCVPHSGSLDLGFADARGDVCVSDGAYKPRTSACAGDIVDFSSSKLPVLYLTPGTSLSQVESARVVLRGHIILSITPQPWPADMAVKVDPNMLCPGYTPPRKHHIY